MQDIPIESDEGKALNLDQLKEEILNNVNEEMLLIIPEGQRLSASIRIVRFVGMGTGNKGLYITGGVCLVAGMALKQLGQVKGARKRLGQ